MSSSAADMLEVLKSTVRPLWLDEQVLEAAYTLYMGAPATRSPAISLYMGAPATRSPAISLKRLAELTGKTPLKCRNAIVEANGLGRFPDCELHP